MPGSWLTSRDIARATSATVCSLDHLSASGFAGIFALRPGHNLVGDGQRLGDGLAQRQRATRCPCLLERCYQYGATNVWPNTLLDSEKPSPAALGLQLQYFNNSFDDALMRDTGPGFARTLSSAAIRMPAAGVREEE